ncbi:MAG: hypothetical protein ACLQED_01560 [Desulfobaccales bacterium]
MNRKEIRLTLAVLLGLLFFTLTCGVALAQYPVFYVKIDNQTDIPVHVHYYWTTRAGADPTPEKVVVIQPGYTTTFHGNPGQGRMEYWTQTTGEGPVRQNMDGDMDPQAWNAHLFIKYNQARKLRVYKPNG